MNIPHTNPYQTHRALYDSVNRFFQERGAQNGPAGEVLDLMEQLLSMLLEYERDCPVKG